ncbi:vanadium-dependent haloperoxidase [Virgibacillus flavescens]|uniref:vanadium-dependent haloperoxidase n=1 Tax=Virgibacillus flavescens TaxID=1611422 RepID=UPI003D35185C
MNYDYLRWSKVPYAGEKKPPNDPVTPLAGSWPLFYLKRDRKGDFLSPSGNSLQLPIKDPNRIDFEQQLIIVQKALKKLTPHQKAVAIYYGTGAPTKQWTPVIDRLIDTYGVTPTLAARIMATVQAALNDTMVVVWDLKYRWDVARPDQYDQTMRTLLCTPRFPTYPSGHATLSGCAEVLLSYYFPKEAKKLKQIAESDAVSRLYAGVHFPADNDEGIELGRYIGRVIVRYLKKYSEIDTSFRNYKDAQILPDLNRQFIPYEFPDHCSSLVIEDDKKKSSKPTLYI